MKNPKFSIIIPTYNEERRLVVCIKSIRTSKDTEVIVVDGGSTDHSIALAKDLGAQTIISKRGRGRQLNQGAQHASGEILLFLHADTRLPENAFILLEEYFKQSQIQIGTFTLCFDHPHWLLDLYARMTNIDSLWTRFGDQCIVVRKDFFNEIRGFPNWPLFEDVRFLQEARKKTKIESFPSNVTTSAEKFLKNGILFQQFKNGWLIIQYLMGASPEKLFHKYYAKN